MDRTLWFGWLTIVCLCVPTTASFALSAGECSGLDVHVTGSNAALAECETSRMGGGEQGTATNEYIQIILPDSVFTLSHAYAGTMSYMQRRDVKAIFDGISTFDSTSDWGEEGERGDFAVRSFKAKFRNDGPEAGCVGFNLYRGHVSRTTGYRHHIAGLYCDLTGRAPTDSKIDEILDSIAFDF